MLTRLRWAGHFGLCALFALLCQLSGPAFAEDGQLIIQPTCADGFDYIQSSKQCKVGTKFDDASKAADCAKLKGTFTEAKDGKPASCAPPKTPAPTCNAPESRRISFKDGQCVLDVSTPTSDAGNYVGDCIEPAGKIPGAPNYKLLHVTEQSEDRKTLYVVPAERPWKIFCKPLEVATDENGQVTNDSRWEPVPIALSDVLRSGAKRTGWVYGMLALPFKYRPGNKSITNSVSVGPYLGARASMAGRAWTHAVTLGLTQIKASTPDGNGGVNDTHVTGFTFAYGLMFDVSKSAKPFKSGVFVGVDQYSKLNGTKVAESGKWWLAVQIGYDFTD